MSDAQASIDTVVVESRRLRDYVIHLGGQSADQLTGALWPFEAEGDRRPGEADVKALLAAFRAAQAEAAERVDPYTLNEVLQGRAPQMASALSWSTVLVSAIGVCLVLLAYSYSNWAGRTAFVLAEAEEFTTFDHFGQVMKLVELEYYFEAAEPAALPTDLEPQIVYLEGISTLARHYSKENDIQARMNGLIRDARPILAALDNTRRRICSATGTVDGLWVDLLSCPPLAVEPSVSSTETAKVASVTDGAVSEPAALPVADRPFFRGRLDDIDRLRIDTIADAGRSTKLAQDYLDSVQRVQAWSVDLQGLLDTVQRWTLPIIYGMLGSVVYCVWRVLSPNIASLNLVHALLRTAFAGLAALTLSMLFIPSNTLAVGSEVSKPLIYLLSFVFGYSIEAFVNTLNRLNSFLATSLAPKERESRAG